MGQTVVEELVLKLTMENSGFEDQTAEKKISSLRQAVKELDSDIKSVTGSLSAVGASFGTASAPKRPTQKLSDDERRARQEARAIDTHNRNIEKSQKVVARETMRRERQEKRMLDVRQRAEERERKMKSRDEKFPSSIGGIFQRVLGPWAAGVYLFKDAVGMIKTAFEAFSRTTQKGAETVNVATLTGIRGETIRSLNALAQEQGFDEDYTQAIAKWAMQQRPVIPGEVPAVARIGVVPQKAPGVWKDPIELLSETITQSMAKGMGDELSSVNWAVATGLPAGLAQSIIEAGGWDAFKKKESEYIKSGRVQTDEFLERQKAIKVREKENTQKLDTLGQKIITDMSDKIVPEKGGAANPANWIKYSHAGGMLGTMAGVGYGYFKEREANQTTNLTVNVDKSGGVTATQDGKPIKSTNRQPSGITKANQ